MIFQWRDQGMVAITQPDHARLAGDIAAVWGNDLAWKPEPWKSLVTAATRHDDGHAEWEISPRLAEGGRPYDFITIPSSERLRVFQRCVELMEKDLGAKLLVSMHVTGLYLGRFEPDAGRLIDALQGEDLNAAEDFVATEGQRQVSLKEQVDARFAMTQYRLLQVFDRLSLILCMQPFDDVQMKFRFVPLVEGGIEEEIGLEKQGDNVWLRPHPFAQDKVPVSVSGRRLEKQTFESEAEYHAALADAPTETFDFAFVRK